MSTDYQLNTAWLAELTNAHHDGTTQQIDDFLQAFVTDNQVFIQKRADVHQARQTEDDVWLTSLRDPAVKPLGEADKRQDCYITALRYTNLAHAGLPDDEPTKAEALECEQVFKDFKFSTRDAYGAESDKIIQMQQNFQAHQTFLTEIGAWTFLTKAVEAAQQVRQLLGERALTMGEFVKGEMKNARRQTDLAIAEIYRTILAMMELMPSAELTALYTQLRGIELYARQYYIGTSSSGSSSENPTPTPGEGGDDDGPSSPSGDTSGDDDGPSSPSGDTSGDDDGPSSPSGDTSGDDDGPSSPSGDTSGG